MSPSPDGPVRVGARRRRGWRSRGSGKAIAVALLHVALPVSAAAQCGSAARFASRLWDQYVVEAREAGCLLPDPVWATRKFVACQFARPANQARLVDRMVGWWNSAEWDSGWATLGPRRLAPDWEQGTLWFTSGRVWLSTAPENTGLATIEIEKLGGSAPTQVDLCMTLEDGSTRRVGSHRFEGGSGTVGERFEAQMRGVENAVVSVRVDAKALNPLARFKYRVRYTTEPRRTDAGPVEGIADLHLHQAAELGFGGNNLWGSHTGPQAQALRPDDRLADTLGSALLQGPIPWAIGLHSLPNLILGDEGLARHGSGYPDFDDWPHFNDVAHQQVHEDWLEEAFEEGLRLVVVSAVNFEGFCLILKAMYPRPGDDAGCRDMDNVRRQIEAFHRMDEAHDWYEIVVDPWHARTVIAEGRLAVVLSFEVSHLLPQDEGDFEDQLDRLWGMGVRSFQLAHETDSRFAGAAPHRWLFEVFQTIKWAYAPQSRWGFVVDEEGKNVVGLTDRGVRLVQAMIDRNMLIDVAHLSERSVRDVFTIASGRGHYPLYDSHTRFEALLSSEDRRVQKEFLTTEEQIEIIRRTGGMVGLRTGQNDLLAAAPGSDASKCAGSSRSFAQLVRYARANRLGVGLGSDLNGFINQLGPRFGSEACPSATGAERGEQRRAQVGSPIGGCQATAARRGRGDFGVDGLRHVGYLPDLVSDLEALEVEGVDALKSSAEFFLRMWERAYDDDRERIPDEADLPNEAARDVGDWSLCAEQEEEEEDGDGTRAVVTPPTPADFEICGFVAEVVGPPLAGTHRGPARVVGNALVLTDLQSGWNSYVELPSAAGRGGPWRPGALAPGTYDIDMNMEVARVPLERDTAVFMASTGEGERFREARASMRVIRIDGGSTEAPGSEPRIEGEIEGRLAWDEFSDRSSYADVTIRFTALPSDRRPDSAYQRCREAWMR